MLRRSGRRDHLKKNEELILWDTPAKPAIMEVLRSGTVGEVSKGLSAPGYRIREVLPKGEGKFVEALCEPAAGGFPDNEADGADDAVDAVDADVERDFAARLPMRLFPGDRNVRVRVVSEEAGRRIVEIKGAARSFLKAGAVLLPREWPVAEGREALFLHDGGIVPDEPAAFRGGPDPSFNLEGLIGRGRLKAEGAYISVRFPHPFPLLPGAEYTFSVGESGTVRPLTLLWPGRPEADERRRLEKSGMRRPNPHPDAAEIYGRLLYVLGFVRLPPVLDGREWPNAARCGNWVLLDDRRKILEGKIRKLARRPGGADKAVLRLPGYPDDLILSLAVSMCSRGELVERGGWFFPPGEPPLSPFHRGWLGRIEAAGLEGIRIRAASSDADREALGALARSGLIAGGEAVWLSRAAYTEAAAVILGHAESGSRFSLAEARSRLGGSRAVTLEVLAVMEDEGSLVRAEDGDARVVV